MGNWVVSGSGCDEHYCCKHSRVSLGEAVYVFPLGVHLGMEVLGHRHLT